jgi:hypothetical protein
MKGVTTGLDNTDPSCPDNCCSTENCLRTLNNNGNPIGIDEDVDPDLCKNNRVVCFDIWREGI